MRLKVGTAVNVEYYGSEKEDGINIVVNISFTEH